MVNLNTLAFGYISFLLEMKTIWRSFSFHLKKMKVNCHQIHWEALELERIPLEICWFFFLVERETRNDRVPSNLRHFWSKFSEDFMFVVGLALSYV